MPTASKSSPVRRISTVDGNNHEKDLHSHMKHRSHSVDDDAAGSLGKVGVAPSGTYVLV